jgi:multidrug efflux system membrane fusion protein
MEFQDHHSAPAAADQPEKSARKIWPWLLAIVIIAMAVFLLQRNHAAPEKTGRKSALDGRPIPVVTAKVQRRDVNLYLDALGTVTPRNSVVVKSRVDGELMRLYFREGEMVKAGDLLAQIDPRAFEAQLAQAQGQLMRDQALLNNAQIDLERYKTLLAQDSIAKQQTDTQAALVQQYRGAIAVDKALVDTARLQVAYSRITAPISGRVGLRQVDPGNMISSADTNGIVSIAELQPITVLYTIPEDNLPTVLARMKLAKAVPVEAFDRSQTTQLASGTLLTIDNQIDPTTGTIKLRAEFKNKESTLYPNQFVNIRMLVNVDENAIVIPMPALQRGRNGDYVYVVNKDGTVSLRDVKIGHTSGETVVIENGLEPGEIVVVDGADKLRDGAKVKPEIKDAPAVAGKAKAAIPAQASPAGTVTQGAPNPRSRP